MIKSALTEIRIFDFWVITKVYIIMCLKFLHKNWDSPFLDSPYEIQELVTDGYLYDILKGLKYEHKELLYLTAVKGLSTTKIAELQGKTDRAVRAMRKTVLNKIRRKAYEYLTSRNDRKPDMTLAEKRFVENYKAE